MHLAFRNYNHNLVSRDSFIELRRDCDLDNLLVEYYNLHTLYNQLMIIVYRASRRTIMIQFFFKFYRAFDKMYVFITG